MLQDARFSHQEWAEVLSACSYGTHMFVPFLHQPVVFPESLPTYLHRGTHRGQVGLNMLGVQKEINGLHSLVKRSIWLSLDHGSLLSLMDRYNIAGKTSDYVAVG
jgi:hypothetical protein